MTARAIYREMVPLLVSAREAAQLLGVGRGKGRGLRALVEDGHLHPLPWLGGRVRYSLAEIQHLAREGIVEGGRPSRPRTATARRGAPAPGVGDRIRAIDLEALAKRRTA